MNERRLAQHPPQRRVEQARKARIGAVNGADPLIEQQRIADAIAGERVNHEPALIGSEHFLGRVLEIENALVDIDNRVEHGQLHVKAWLCDGSNRLTETDHQRLLGHRDLEQRPERGNQQDEQKTDEDTDQMSSHRAAPVVGWFVDEAVG